MKEMLPPSTYDVDGDDQLAEIRRAMIGARLRDDHAGLLEQPLPPPMIRLLQMLARATPLQRKA